MKKNDKGFTLIELLAVIVVLAIIMVIATMAVNRQIKKARKDANDINKEVIAKAAKTCLVENAQEDCDTIEELQEKGYLEEFEDPWTGESNNLDDSYTITIKEDGTDAKVMYFGDGITEEVETPPEEYFSWCNSKKTCTDGLTSEGKEWLQKHNDILIFPDNVTTIKDCQASSNDCNNFSGINISSLIVTSSVSVSANFSNSTINVVRIDGGNLSNSVFKNTNIKKFTIGNASKISVGEHTFSGSIIQDFTIETGTFSWYGFQYGKIGTLTIGAGVTNLGSNTFQGTEIDTIILKANISRSDVNNQTFRSSSYGTTLIIDENVTKLPKNLFGNTINDYNGYVHWFDLKDVIVKGDKTRFSKQDLYNFGLRWDQIPDDIGNPDVESSYNLHIARSTLRWGAAKNSAEEFAKQKSWFIIDEDK